MRARHYRVELSPECSLDELTASLLATGWRDESVLEGLSTLVNSSGHRVLIVKKTRRVQIRVSYSVVESERRWAAESVYVEFSRILEGSKS